MGLYLNLHKVQACKRMVFTGAFKLICYVDGLKDRKEGYKVQFDQFLKLGIDVPLFTSIYQ